MKNLTLTGMNNPEPKAKNILELRPSTLSDLAQIYGISIPTMKLWIKPFLPLLGEKTGNYFNPRQVRILLENLEMPTIKKLDEDLDDSEIEKIKTKKKRKFSGTLSSTGKHWKSLEGNISNADY